MFFITVLLSQATKSHRFVGSLCMGYFSKRKLIFAKLMLEGKSAGSEALCGLHGTVIGAIRINLTGAVQRLLLRLRRIQCISI